MGNLIEATRQLDLKIKIILRGVDRENTSQVKKRALEQIRLACNEVKLDVRDYEYAETLAEQKKWARIGRHNLKALEQNILLLDDVFGPADVAELSAVIEQVRLALR
jgi:hypothetical protein